MSEKDHNEIGSSFSKGRMKVNGLAVNLHLIGTLGIIRIKQI